MFFLRRKPPSTPFGVRKMSYNLLASTPRWKVGVLDNLIHLVSSDNIDSEWQKMTLLNSLILHSLTHSISYLLTHSLAHSVTLSLNPSFTYLLTHSITDLLTLSPSHSITKSLTHSNSNCQSHRMTFVLDLGVFSPPNRYQTTADKICQDDGCAGEEIDTWKKVQKTTPTFECHFCARFLGPFCNTFAVSCWSNTCSCALFFNTMTRHQRNCRKKNRQHHRTPLDENNKV